MNKISEELLFDDFFLLSDGNQNLIYSPLRRIVFEVLPEGMKAIRESQKKGNGETLFKDITVQKTGNLTNRTGEKYFPSRLVLSLTSNCNLRCIYCYAEAGKKKINMPWSIAKTAIDQIIKNQLTKGGKKIGITFHGGGEPFMAFPLMKKCVEYTDSIWNNEKDYSVVTNGTLITPEIADWLKEKNFRLTLSLDGPAEIQNYQRPKANGEGSFEDAIRGGTLLKERNIKFGIRATITNSNVFKIPDLLNIAKDLNCGLKLEPFTPVGRGTDNDLLSINDFYEQFFLAKVRATEMEVKLKSTYSLGFEPRCLFCAGDGEMFCVLPDGKVSTCSRVTKDDDLLAPIFIVGEIQGDNLIIDSDKVEHLRHLNVMYYEQCEACFAKWYCAGGCHNTRLLNSGEMPKDHCDLEKIFLWESLCNELKSKKEGGEKNV